MFVEIWKAAVPLFPQPVRLQICPMFILCIFCYVYDIYKFTFKNYRHTIDTLRLTLNLLTTTIVAPPSNVRKWQIGFNSAFKGLIVIFQIK
jgi:hypothetical protein